jgi:nucleoid DNA-binding protein
LRPKKAKEFIPEVAEQLNLSKDCVADIVYYYWEEMRKSLSSLKHQRIHATNLGDFTLKHWKIDDKIDMLEKWENKNKLKGMQEMTARFKTAETLYDLKTIKSLIEEENQRKEFIKLHKHESKRKHNKDMEEQGTDIGGDNK